MEKKYVRNQSEARRLYGVRKRHHLRRYDPCETLGGDSKHLVLSQYHIRQYMWIVIENEIVVCPECYDRKISKGKIE